MLSFAIRRSKEQRKAVSTQDVVDAADRQHFLDKQISSSFYTVGDRVRFKKPRRNPVYGVITEIICDSSKCVWNKSGLPMNIVVQVGKQLVKTNKNKLLYEGRSQ